MGIACYILFPSYWSLFYISDWNNGRGLFAKEQVLDSSQSKVGEDGDSQMPRKWVFKGAGTPVEPGEDSGGLYEMEDLPDFDKDGYYKKENHKGILEIERCQLVA